MMLARGTEFGEFLGLFQVAEQPGKFRSIRGEFLNRTANLSHIQSTFACRDVNTAPGRHQFMNAPDLFEQNPVHLVAPLKSNGRTSEVAGSLSWTACGLRIC